MTTKISTLLLLAAAALCLPTPSPAAHPALTADSLVPAVPANPIRIRGVGQVLGDPTQPGGAPFFAAGQSNMLGQWSNRGILAIDPGTGAATGNVTFVAANKDLLHASFTGVFDPRTGIATATFTWLGGTGRFATARGSAGFTVAQDPSGSFTFTAIGSISR